MTELIICCLVLAILFQVLSNGDSIDLDRLLGGPELAALGAFLFLLGAVVVRTIRLPPALAGHFPAIGMLGIGTCGLLLALFPERMLDTVRGGTMMTAFWACFGWLLICLSLAVVLLLRLS